MPKMTTSTTRPLSVTVISWFFILWAVLLTIPKAFVLIDRETRDLTLAFAEMASEQGFLQVPVWFQLSHAFIGVPVIIVSGLGLLKGRLWALVTLVLWMVGSVSLSLAVTGLSFSAVLKLGTAGFVVVILTRPRPLAFVSSHRPDKN